MRLLESNRRRLTLISAVVIVAMLAWQLPLALAESAKTPGAAQASAGTASPDVNEITLTSPNAQAVGFFGWSVAISGKTVVVGAPYETADTFGVAGHAYIY